MKFKKYILSTFVACCTLTTFSSCTDWLDEQPNDKQSEEQQFATKPGFYAAVNGIYDRMSGNSLYGKNLSYEMIDVLGQCYEVNKTDECSYYKYLRALADWDYSNEQVMAVLGSVWNEAYQTIMNINVVIKNIEEKGGILPEKEYKMLKGEMLACRAMIHFDLLRLYGPIYSKNPEGRGIPYNESTKTDILPILSAQTVLNDKILEDLKEAQELLLESDPVLTEGPRAEYDSETMDNSMRYRQLRLNYYATTLLMARAYLWGGDYANAAIEARKITDDVKVKEFFPHVDAGKLLATIPTRIVCSPPNVCLVITKRKEAKFTNIRSVNLQVNPSWHRVQTIPMAVYSLLNCMITVICHNMSMERHWTVKVPCI